MIAFSPVGLLGVDVSASILWNEGLCLRIQDKCWKLRALEEVRTFPKSLKKTRQSNL